MYHILCLNAVSSYILNRRSAHLSGDVRKILHSRKIPFKTPIHKVSPFFSGTGYGIHSFVIFAIFLNALYCRMQHKTAEVFKKK